MNNVDCEEYYNLCEEAVNTWGISAQKLMVIEEMSELTKEICKFERGKYNYEELAEEIADVLIMLQQLEIMLALENEVDKQVIKKMARLEKRLDKYKKERAEKRAAAEKI